MPRGRTSESWTPAHRKAQSAWMHQNKPWLLSTGPRTEEGKRASAYRSLKHGRRSASVHAAGSVVACVEKLAGEL